MAKIKDVVESDNPACNHKWVKRNKETIQILTRVCTECGKVEEHSEQDVRSFAEKYKAGE